ncbi:MAG: molybdenum ABC transporter ATP-binding protein [Rhodospirillales bacterium]|nr:molybdenum ABC transporter ATP-binding protein [Rhodospirillales bacterium]
MSDGPVLNIDLEHQQGAFRLAVSLRLQGGLTAFYGRSGSGKTSLINLIAGLERPDVGTISLGEQVLYDSARRINIAPEKRQIGYVFQDGRLFPHLDVAANLTYARRFITTELSPDRFAQIVELLGISALLGRRPATLSGGEKQRVAIGRALLSEPQLLLMDEPLASLDAARKAEILPFIENLRDQLKTPILYVSHAMEEVVRLADSLVLIDDGRIIAHGSVEQTLSRLDLRPLTGRYEAGAVLQVEVCAHDHAYQLSTLRFAGQQLVVPAVDLPIGSGLRVRIRARDVSLSTSKPVNTSVLNVFAATVMEIAPDEGPHCEVLLNIGAPLIARITRKSAAELGLAIGKKVYASVKAAAIDRHNLGLRGSPVNHS